MKITVECPLCKKKQEIEVDNNIKNADKLTVISIPEKLICKHQFQVYVDNNFSVRGYEKVEIIANKKDLVDNRTVEDKFKSLF